MKNKLFLVLVFLAHLCHAQIEGTWNGELDTQAMKLPVIVTISKKQRLYCSLSKPQSKLQGISCRQHQIRQ